jgi:hypothetical protein
MDPTLTSGTVFPLLLFSGVVVTTRYAPPLRSRLHVVEELTLARGPFPPALAWAVIIASERPRAILKHCDLFMEFSSI